MTALEDIVQWEARLSIPLDLLNESQPKAVSGAASLLGYFLDRFAAGPEVVEILLGPHRASIISRLLEVACSPNQYVQSAALGTLARLGCTDGYELAATAIDSPNSYVRETGIRLFGLAAPDNELARLESLIDDPHRPASVAAVRAMVADGGKPRYRGSWICWRSDAKRFVGSLKTGRPEEATLSPSCGRSSSSWETRRCRS